MNYLLFIGRRDDGLKGAESIWFGWDSIEAARAAFERQAQAEWAQVCIHKNGSLKIIERGTRAADGTVTWLEE